MSEEKTMYEVGDFAVLESYGRILRHIEVERVTPTQAILKDGTRLKRDKLRGQSEIGATQFSSDYYRYETQEIKERWALQEKRKAVKEKMQKRFNLEHLPSPLLDELDAFLEKLA